MGVHLLHQYAAAVKFWKEISKYFLMVTACFLLHLPFPRCY